MSNYSAPVAMVSEKFRMTVQQYNTLDRSPDLIVNRASKTPGAVAHLSEVLQHRCSDAVLILAQSD